MQYSQEHLKTMVYAKFGGQTECIMENWKIENAYRIYLPVYPQLPRGARATFLDVRSLLSRSLEQAVLDFAKRPMR